MAKTGHRVVVLGAGYAGLPAAQRLARLLCRDGARVTIVNASPRFVERPRLHQVATGQRVADLPLRGLLERTGAELLVGRVTGIDLERHDVRVETAEGPLAVPYDTLVYGLGSMIDVDSVPGARAHAHTLATPESAARLRDEGVRLADRQGTLVVCGGGLTGIEAAAEYAESHPGLTVRLVTRGEPGDWLSPAGRTHLRGAFDRLDVEVIGGTEVSEVREGALVLTGGGTVPFDACLWAGGFTVPALGRRAGLAVNGSGRILVDRTLRSVSHPEVYAVGDAAAVSGGWGEAIAYGCRTGGFTAPYVAGAIADSLAGRAAKPFGFRYIHQCISLGRRDALIQFVHPRDESPLRFVLTGRPAVLYKELTLAGATWYFRRPGPYLPRRRRRALSGAAAAHEEV